MPLFCCSQSTVQFKCSLWERVSLSDKNDVHLMDPSHFSVKRLFWLCVCPVAGCKESSMWHKPGAGNKQHGTHRADTDAHSEDTQGPPCQDLCHALGFRFKVNRKNILNRSWTFLLLFGHGWLVFLLVCLSVISCTCCMLFMCIIL